eukprot:TRINITY_DN8060_c0_g1_i1.p1 TRINITY_DN8060_c0_g1~~TRINITY_DN8060_c0_g1_i1.p1  ORF type:complete len:401 (+),score=107.54 TRINITY_DN8060_c0_g1_i1:91-1203(+)
MPPAPRRQRTSLLSLLLLGGGAVAGLGTLRLVWATAQMRSPPPPSSAAGAQSHRSASRLEPHRPAPPTDAPSAEAAGSSEHGAASSSSSSDAASDRGGSAPPALPGGAPPGGAPALAASGSGTSGSSEAAADGDGDGDGDGAAAPRSSRAADPTAPGGPAAGAGSAAGESRSDAGSALLAPAAGPAAAEGASDSSSGSAAQPSAAARPAPGEVPQRGRHSRTALRALVSPEADVLGIGAVGAAAREEAVRNRIRLVAAEAEEHEPLPPRGSDVDGSAPVSGNGVAARAAAAIRRVQWKGPRGRFSGLALGALVGDGADVLGIAGGARRQALANLERALQAAREAAAHEAEAEDPDSARGAAPGVKSPAAA